MVSKGTVKVKVGTEAPEEISPIKKLLCGEHSVLGNLAEIAVGKARACWCCSFWRGAAYGVLAGFAVGALLI